MRILIIALGSRGDVQPYVALGTGLKAAGHDVRLLAHENFDALVRSHGLEFWPARGNVQEIMQSAEMRELVEGGNFLAITSQTAKMAQGAAVQWAEDGLAACQGVDLVIAGIGGLYIGLALAEKLGVPFLQAYLVPFTATGAFPAVLFPQAVSRLGGYANRLSHHASRQLMWQGFRTADRLARREVLDLPTVSFLGPYRTASLRQSPVLYGFSPFVIPKPLDWPQPIHVTGYWFLETSEDWTPPADLLAFLDGGPPPVYVGFGSMGDRNPEETAGIVLQALAHTQQRAVMLSGWGGLGKAGVPDTVYLAESLPHSWLFSRVAAVVHHGGAGTTAAGLRAGVPSVIIPFFGDQPFWGRRVAELGAGPAPTARKKLTVERLAQAIHRAVSDPAMQQAAAALGERIRSEDGIANAVAVIEGIESWELVRGLK